jgi:hypothetical protein
MEQAMNDVTKQLIRPVLDSLVRRGIVALVAWMVTWSEVKPDEAWVNSTTAIIVGAILWLLVESWSWVSKKKLLATAPTGAVIVPKDAVASIAGASVGRSGRQVILPGNWDAMSADEQSDWVEGHIDTRNAVDDYLPAMKTPNRLQQTASSSRIGPTNTLGAILLALMMIPAGAVAVAVGGCAGQQAREEVGVPATLKAVDSIVSDASLGIDTLPVEDRDNAQIDLDAFAEAIRSGDLVTIQADAYPRWPVVHSLIKAGIESRLDAKTLGPAGASIRLNRAASYGDVLESFVWSPLGQ